MIVVTGASGQLGRLVIHALLANVPAAQIVAAVRRPERLTDLAAQRIVVRRADYGEPDSLIAAFKGADKVLLISSSEVGQRTPQHQNVIAAARKAGVSQLVYTSLLHADTSPLGLAAEHRATEALLRDSGVPHVLLRNGWYTENYLAGVPSALEHGAFIGSAGEGRIASAARADYAAAAAAVLTRDHQAGRVYELAGDDSYTLAELAAELSRQTGRAIPYVNLSEAEYKHALVDAGLPESVAGLFAESDVGASKGGLFDAHHQLSQLIGRATTSLATLMQVALRGTRSA